MKEWPDANWITARRNKCMNMCRTRGRNLLGARITRASSTFTRNCPCLRVSHGEARKRICNQRASRQTNENSDRVNRISCYHSLPVVREQAEIKISCFSLFPFLFLILIEQRLASSSEILEYRVERERNFLNGARGRQDISRSNRRG